MVQALFISALPGKQIRTLVVSGADTIRPNNRPELQFLRRLSVASTSLIQERGGRSRGPWKSLR
jgi:hypothetical protein